MIQASRAWRSGVRTHVALDVPNPPGLVFQVHQVCLLGTPRLPFGYPKVAFRLRKVAFRAPQGCLSGIPMLSFCFTPLVSLGTKTNVFTCTKAVIWYMRLFFGCTKAIFPVCQNRLIMISEAGKAFYLQAMWFYVDRCQLVQESLQKAVLHPATIPAA